MDERLSHDLSLLVAMFQQGDWHTLRLKSDAVSLTLSQSRDVRPIVSTANATARSPASGETGRDAARAAQKAPPLPSEIDAAWCVTSAPNLGTFYRSPKPGSPPFVEVGQRVEAGDELCLVEVMKLFTSVRAECGGTVRHIAVSDAELVETGQALMYIEEDGG